MSRPELNTASSPTSAASGRYACPNILQPDDNIMETAFPVILFRRPDVLPSPSDWNDVGVGGVALPDNRRKSKAHVPATLPAIMLADLLQHRIASPGEYKRQVVTDCIFSMVEANFVAVEASRRCRRKVA